MSGRCCRSRGAGHFARGKSSSTAATPPIRYTWSRRVGSRCEVMTPLGDQATIAIRGPGDSFGEMAIVGAGAKRSATVEALEETETFCVLESEFRRLRRRESADRRAADRFLANEVRLLNERLLEALYVPVERRVLRRLVELARLYRDGDEAPVQSSR